MFALQIIIVTVRSSWLNVVSWLDAGYYIVDLAVNEYLDVMRIIIMADRNDDHIASQNVL